MSNFKLILKAIGITTYRIILVVGCYLIICWIGGTFIYTAKYPYPYYLFGAFLTGGVVVFIVIANEVYENLKKAEKRK